MSTPLTKIGYEKLKSELTQLKQVDRLAVISDIAVARDHGDLKENAEYHAAREQQGHIEDRIHILENLLSNVTIIDPLKLSGNRVMFSGTVTIVNEDTDEKSTYQLVSEYESDLKQGKISYTSPIGRALIGKEVGESVNVVTPSGDKYYEILEVDYN